MKGEKYWKELIVQVAKNTVRKERRLILDFRNEEAKKKAIQLLKEMLGEKFHVVNSG